MQLEDILFRQKEERERSAEFITFESKRLKAWRVTAGLARRYRFGILRDMKSWVGDRPFSPTLGSRIVADVEESS